MDKKLERRAKKRRNSSEQGYPKETRRWAEPV